MEYDCDWQHGPAPGLTFYSGTVKVYAENPEKAKEKARRLISERNCFSPQYITITRVKEVIHD